MDIYEGEYSGGGSNLGVIVVVVLVALLAPIMVDMYVDQYPGDTLYTVERFGESELEFVGLYDRAERMDERYREYEVLASEGKGAEYADILYDAGRMRMAAHDEVEGIRSSAASSESFVDDLEAIVAERRLQDAVEFHVSKLNEVKVNIPQEAQDAVNKDMENSAASAVKIKADIVALQAGIKSKLGQDVVVERSEGRYVAHIPGDSSIKAVYSKPALA